jgi:hypothetical protein
MRTLVRCVAVAAGMFALVAARTSAVNNPIIVTIANGPFAGRYQSDAADTYCMRQTKHNTLSATWQAADMKGAKAFSLAAVDVYDISGAGPKFGDVHVAFGDPQKKPLVYEVRHGPLTMTKEGKATVLAFDGKTKDGIELRVRATCATIDEL